MQGSIAYGLIVLGVASFGIAAFLNYTSEEIVRWVFWGIGGAVAASVLNQLWRGIVETQERSKRQFDYLVEEMKRQNVVLHNLTWQVGEIHRICEERESKRPEGAVKY
jgi:hypothetical protein